MDTYAAYCRDKNILRQSSSGGIFTLIANYILEKNGVIYGAAFNENLEVVHTRIDKKENLFKLRESKYVQSLLKDTYKEALQDLNEGKYVLYTGTPCQIAGLKMFLGKDYDKLYTQDIICHGVPTINAWNEYKKYLTNKYKSNIKKFSFRNKSEGWENYSVKIEFENGRKIRETLHKNLYMKAFLKNVDLRESCYHCNYKTKKRISDVTLADFWGVSNVCPEMYNKNGTSLVVIQSEKGKELFNNIKDRIKYKKVDLDKAIVYNSAMIKSVEYNVNRENFFKELDKNNFKTAVNKYIPKMTIKQKTKNFLGKVKRKILRIIK